MFRHCTLFPHAAAFQEANPRIVEIGRLSISRTFRRRREDASGDAAASSAEYLGGERRRQRDEIFLIMTRALFQSSKRIGAAHWLVAMERSLQRMLARHGFPFRVIGPETDYFGPVAPYQMDLAELDRVIVSARYPGLTDFHDGLEPELRPQPDACDHDVFVLAGDATRPAATTPVSLR
jgi:N-acyl amino acid synthase of PEP-CTERM/exosortase system